MPPTPAAPTQTERAQTFRALHHQPGGFVIPNPHDAGTARILHALGFQALATTSAGFAWSLGQKDGAITRAEALANARAIVDATPLPVSADLEDGYGHDPAAVAETIRLAHDAGLVGCSIEDATGDPAQPIYPLDEAIARIAAAVAAARALPTPFTLTARAENFLHGRPDLPDTIRRLQAFEAAGADVLYAPGLPTLDAVRQVCVAVGRPVNVVAGRTGTTAEIFAAGARRISLGALLSRAALGAFAAAAREIAGPGTLGFVPAAMTSAEANALMRGRA